MENAAADAVLNTAVVHMTVGDEGEGARTLRSMATRTTVLP